MKMPTTSDVLDVISGLLGLVLVGCGAWYWYNSNVQDPNHARTIRASVANVATNVAQNACLRRENMAPLRPLIIDATAKAKAACKMAQT